MIKHLAARVGDRLYTRDGKCGIVTYSQVTLEELTSKDDPKSSSFWIVTEYGIRYDDGEMEKIREVKDWKPKTKHIIYHY